MLECSGLSVFYQQHQALEKVALRIAHGEIVVILGANGAGKSTLLKAISGLVPVTDSSRILVDGKSIVGWPPHLIVEAGVSLVPEGRRLFGELTVQENLLLGAYARRARRTEKGHLHRVFELFPQLAERKGQIARTMSGGEQQMVAIGRAMMSAPAILMLDEPSLGLSPLLCAELFKTLVEVRKTGVGILLVEQNAKQGLSIADRGYLLENGKIVGEDSAAELSRNSAVQEAYLGGAGETGPEPAGEPQPAPQFEPQPISPPMAGNAGNAGNAANAGNAEHFKAPPGFALHHSPASGGGRNSGGLAAADYTALVNKAADIQTEYIRAQRPARLETPPSGREAQASGPDTGLSPRASAGKTDSGGESLAEALVRIEEAAARARK